MDKEYWLCECNCGYCEIRSDYHGRIFVYQGFKCPKCGSPALTAKFKLDIAKMVFMGGI